MAHVQFLDEIIREYLLFRGFGSTVKSFEADLKGDREKSFRADKIIDQLWHFIGIYDLNSLKDLWNHLDTHMFAKLESHFTSGVKKLENGVLKMYLVNAVVNNKPEKVTEFFTKLTPELQNQSEWKEWFMLPYIKNPEENPTFSLHFTKQWQDTLLVSLNNFLASIFQYMPTPTLMRFEEDANRIRNLDQTNQALRKQIEGLTASGAEDGGGGAATTPCHIDPPQHLLDDFYIIAQESSSSDSQAKSLKNLIRNMGSGSSPILGRKDNNGVRKRPRGQSYFYDT
ncbi:PREDICTED: WD repeat-containing protein 91 [Nicrophorus vespilloides]|uniref:WD repeat-containing protein 91 n=1 Tax=Nicrophorus vespilloides TaxID=110193 RepID=A0ABM1MWK1_NICVS|nr:PREDICTED: WD repeat-containing protein 91 [Nicrophorus vespilloides]